MAELGRRGLIAPLNQAQRLPEAVRMRAHEKPPSFLPFWMGLVPLALLATSGCGDGQIARYPVTGTVKVDGKPVEGALVIYCPVEGPPELMRERPYGRTNAQGVYELRTLEPGDGAPAGNYNIMVRWLTGGSASQGRGEERGQAVTDRLGGRYTNPETSGLSYTVVEGPNTAPPLELKSR